LLVIFPSKMCCCTHRDYYQIIKNCYYPENSGHRNKMMFELRKVEAQNLCRAFDRAAGVVNANSRPQPVPRSALPAGVPGPSAAAAPSPPVAPKSAAAMGPPKAAPVAAAAPAAAAPKAAAAAAGKAMENGSAAVRKPLALALGLPKLHECLQAFGEVSLWWKGC
jgi:hypothetical protein